MGSGPTLMTPFYLSHLFKCWISKYSHILRSCGLGHQHTNLVVMQYTVKILKTIMVLKTPCHI